MFTTVPSKVSTRKILFFVQFIFASNDVDCQYWGEGIDLYMEFIFFFIRELAISLNKKQSNNFWRKPAYIQFN